MPEKETKFFGVYDVIEKTPQNCGTHKEAQYIEIEPFAIDETTGEILNKTNKKILKRIEDRDFYEEIQSYKDECDIYKILERSQLGLEDPSLHTKIAQFNDYVNLPDNIHDLMDMIKQLPKEYREELANGKDINAFIDKEVKKALIKNGFIKEDTKPTEPVKETATNE